MIVRSMAAALFLLTPELASGQGVPLPTDCIEPIKPYAEDYLAQAAKAELRDDFNYYFKDVEAYLNCLNAMSVRVHTEAQRAANEYARLLDLLPPAPWQAEPEQEVPQIEMRDSGTINLGPES